LPALSIDFVVGTLLTTTFVSVGLLGLWAGVSRWHWFVRSLVVMAAFVPVVLIPAYEAMLVLLIQLVVCAIGGKTYVIWADTREHAKVQHDDSSRPFVAHLRFSVTDLLLAMILAALVFFVLVQKSREELLHDWPTYLLTGSMVGCTVLVSAWVVFARASIALRSIAIVIMATLASLSLSFYNEWTEYFTDTLQPEDFINWPNINISNWTTVWLPVVIGVVLLVIAELLLLRKSRFVSILGCGRAVDFPADGPFLRMAGLVFLLVFLMYAAPPAVTCWKLLHPLPLLRIQPPEPNGYDTLTSAGQMFNSRILSTAVAPTSTEQLATEVEKYAAAYDRVQLGLSYEIANPRWSSDKPCGDDVLMDAVSNFRNISRALSMKCELARRQLRYDDLATTAMANIQLGIHAARQGVITEYLTGAAIEGVGRSDLHSVLGKLDATDYRQLVDSLTRMESQRETLDTIVYRDRVWSENAYGWQGHLFEFLWELAGGYWIQNDLYDTIHPRELAKCRLLLMEVALHSYYSERDEFPSRLSELVPGFIPEIAIDPFSTEGEPLVYRRLEDKYVLYSLGQNRRDDDGSGQDETVNGFTDWDTGDLRLDLLYEE
jgi:hypothetical protein